MGPRGEAGETTVYGYGAAAELIAGDSDNEAFIFRKFGNLAARRLLSLEAELIELEEEQRKLDGEVRDGDRELKFSMEKYENFIKHANDDRGPEKVRVDLAKEIDEKLDKYCKN